MPRQSAAAAMFFGALAVILLLAWAGQKAPKPASAEDGQASAAGANARPEPSHRAGPKIRTITAFVRLDRARYRAQMQEAAAFLRRAQDAFQQAGYEIQTLRLTTQPFPEYTADLSPQATLDFFRQLDQLADTQGLLVSIGPANSSGGDFAAHAELLAKIISATNFLNGSICIADDDGVNPKAVAAAAAVIAYLGAHTPHSQGNFRFAATALVPSGGPFYPASYYNGVGNQFAIGLQSANVVAQALRATHDVVLARRAIETALGQYVSEVENIGRRIAAESNWIYGGIDVSPAPLQDVSIAAGIEAFTGARMGSSGTLTAAALITQALRAIPVGHIGYSGLMLPILEDSVLAERWSEGALSVDSVLAYSSVCGTGLDVVPLPGDVSASQLERILGDLATLAFRLHKPLSARLLPVAGKYAGDMTEFTGPYLTNVRLQALP